MGSRGGMFLAAGTNCGRIDPELKHPEARSCEIALPDWLA